MNSIMRMKQNTKHWEGWGGISQEGARDIHDGEGYRDLRPEPTEKLVAVQFNLDGNPGF